MAVTSQRRNNTTKYAGLPGNTNCEVVVQPSTNELDRPVPCAARNMRPCIKMHIASIKGNVSAGWITGMQNFLHQNVNISSLLTAFIPLTSCIHASSKLDKN